MKVVLEDISTTVTNGFVSFCSDAQLNMADSASFHKPEFPSLLLCSVKLSFHLGRGHPKFPTTHNDLILEVIFLVACLLHREDIYRSDSLQLRADIWTLSLPCE